ncbi:MAG: hypothetical protein GXN96_01380 [Aquificae bacterium]|nr:hypothetical protein [Aquificota bacterium]
MRVENLVDTLGYDAYVPLPQLGEELQAEELGFFKSIRKAFKKVFRGVRKVFRKPLKVVKRVGKGLWKGLKKAGTKAWKLVRRNKRTLTAVGLLWAGKYLPAIKPVASAYATEQFTNVATKYLSRLPSGYIETPPAPLFPYPSPEPGIDKRTQNTDLSKALLPIGLMLAGLFLFRR